MDDKMDLFVDRKHYYSWIDRWMMMYGQVNKIAFVFLFHSLTIPHASLLSQLVTTNNCLTYCTDPPTKAWSGYERKGSAHVNSISLQLLQLVMNSFLAHTAQLLA